MDTGTQRTKGAEKITVEHRITETEKISGKTLIFTGT
jgi:hypothetical protein